MKRPKVRLNVMSLANQLPLTALQLHIPRDTGTKTVDLVLADVNTLHGLDGPHTSKEAVPLHHLSFITHALTRSTCLTVK